MSKIVLELDLVPSSSWFNNVRSAVTSAQWNKIKSSVYSAAWYKCQICGGTGPKHPVECHEIWKYDDKLSIQTLIGMIALCPNCHMVKHFGLAQIQGKEEKAFQHFLKVNKINATEGKKLIKNYFKIWQKRSKIKWKVDISYLETEYNVQVKGMVIK